MMGDYGRFVTDEDLQILKNMRYAGNDFRYQHSWAISPCPFCRSAAELWTVTDPDDKAEERDGYGSKTEEKAAVVRCSSCGAISPILKRTDRINGQPIRGPLGPEVIQYWNCRYFV